MNRAANNAGRSGRARTWLMMIALVAWIAAEAAFRVGLFGPFDQRIQDMWFQWQGKHVTPAHVVIVAIDEETLSAYPDDPMVFWTDRLATTIARLKAAGARAVAVDVLLSISPERWLGKLGGELQRAARDYDQHFRAEINDGKVVLVSSRIGSGEVDADYLLPSPDYLLALPDYDLRQHIGLGDLLDEGDGVIRRQVPAPAVHRLGRLPEGEDTPLLGLAPLLVLNAEGAAVRDGHWQIGGRRVSFDQPPEAIPFAGPPGSFPTISLRALLGDAVPASIKSQVADKMVLIGATAGGLNDEHFTPYATRLFAGRGPLMSGVEIHANIAEALVTGRRLNSLDPLLRVLSALLLAVSAVFIFARTSPARSVIVMLAICPMVLITAYASFAAGLLIPVISYLATVALALLGVLGWRLTGEERERARVRQIFGKYVSDQVVDAILSSGMRPEMGGKSQEVTILFSDIRNFTTISERLDAGEVVEMLNTYFERACAPVLAEGGSIDKFIGDAIMVEFGSPLPLEDHALRAVRAAVALAAVAQDFGVWLEQRFPGRDLPRFAIGIGLHSGEAVIGNIGAPSRMEFTAIGDSVNLASRIEGMTKQLGCTILASHSTVVAAGGRVVTGRSETVQVKGREAPVELFEVLQIKTD